MKKVLLTAVIAGLMAVVGCDRGTPGGPGAKQDQKNDNKNNKVENQGRQGEDTFTLGMPTASPKIKQGETREVNIKINRGKNFGQDVTLRFDNLPKGVTIEPASPKIKAGDTEAKVMVKATEDAALGEATVKVNGQPKDGPAATNELRLTVEKK